MRYLKLILILSFLTPVSVLAQQKNSPQSADKIVALVNDQIILKSDIDQSVSDYIRQASFNQQNVTFTKELWYSFWNLKLTINYYWKRLKLIPLRFLTNKLISKWMPEYPS